jgi:hypothetical protein
MSTRKVTIANKRRISITPNGEVFSTGSGKNKIFTIPHSQIVSKKPSGVPYNDVHTEPATEYEITGWIFGKLKEDFEKVKDHNIIMPK